MKKAGIRFELQDGYSYDLIRLLESIDLDRYKWKIGNDSVHLIINNKFKNDLLFPRTLDFIDGSELNCLIRSNEYGIIFLTLYGVKDPTNYTIIKNYKDFLNSSCEIMIDINDSVYTFILCKDESILEKLYENAVTNGYERIKYITEEDLLRNEKGFFS